MSQSSSNPSVPVATAERPLVITRVFEAPRELVFRAWTDPKHLAQWWGPACFTVPRCEADARPGGKIHIDMRAPDGTVYPMGGEYREVTPPGRVVFVSSVPGGEGGRPLFEILNTVTLTEEGGRTVQRLELVILSEGPGAAQFLAGMQEGWRQSLVRLGEHLGGGTRIDPAGAAPEREVVCSRLFDAPRELVWRAWTDPKHVAQWWGPAGFLTTTYRYDLKPGGQWRFVMHGPDGKDYENLITYTEVVPNERLVYEQGGDKETEAVKFSATVTFADEGAGKTRLTMRMTFPSAAMREHVVKTYGAIPGLREHLGRLTRHLAERERAEEVFVISRTFDAPRDLVWKAWTEPARLAQWFGPKGFTVDIVSFDLRPEGVFHYAMTTPTGQTMYGKWIFREIVPPQRLCVLVAFSDENQGVTRHPMSATWPALTLSETTLAEHEGRTVMTLRWSPYEATAEERATFKAGHESMKGGWGGTMDQLEAYLAANR